MDKRLFDADWRFSKGDGRESPVTLPHDAQIYEPRSADFQTGPGGGYFKSGFYTYAKTFTFSSEYTSKNICLEFEGVYQWAEVSVNGHLAAARPYGYSSFIADITGYLNIPGVNTVTVRANNTATPNTRWYSGAGIYRHVWLRAGGGTYIKPWGVLVKTIGNKTAEIKTELQGMDEATVRHTIYFKGDEVAALTGGCVQRADIPGARLWSVEEPNLYTIGTELICKGEVIDRETSIFGVRNIEIGPALGFRLNGAPMKLKGGCVHHDNGLLGSASFDRAEERKIELLKTAGYNAIRCAHNPPSPAMLDACDRLGMLVIDESFDCWRMGKNPNDYHLFFEDWWERDMAAMLRRDYNHPSVVMWSVGNEIYERYGESNGLAWAKKLAGFVRSADDTRPVTAALCAPIEKDGSTGEKPEGPPFFYRGRYAGDNDPWGDRTAGLYAYFDVAGYNYLYERYGHDHGRFPERVICGTETFPACMFETWGATLANCHVIGDFTWTALDYLGESGIGSPEWSEPLTWDAPYPWHQAFCGDIDVCGFKRPQSYYRDVLWGVRDIPYIGVRHPGICGVREYTADWSWPSVLENWTFPGCEGKTTTVDVYSDKVEVELLVNGKSYGRKQAGAKSRNTAVFDVVYEPGVITAIAWSGQTECGRRQLKTAGAPAAIRLTPDRNRIKKEYGDLSYITAEIADADGETVKYADHEITFSVTGTGSLQAVGSGNPKSEEPYFGNTRRAFHGRAMAVVKSAGEAGSILIRASSEGLLPAEAEIITD